MKRFLDALTMFSTEDLRSPEEVNRPELNDPAAVAHSPGVRSAELGPGAAQQALAA